MNQLLYYSPAAKCVRRVTDWGYSEHLAKYGRVILGAEVIKPRNLCIVPVRWVHVQLYVDAANTLNPNIQPLCKLPEYFPELFI